MDEKFNLGSQIKRAASSIPANIAEGHGRFHYLDNIRFCYTARGSLVEVQSHLSLAIELEYLPEDVYSRLTNDAESVGKQLNNYISFLRRSHLGEKDSPDRKTIREEPGLYVSEDYEDPMNCI